MKSFHTIEYEENKTVATLRLNRPESRNAINADMIHELHEVFNTVMETKNIKALVIKGKGNVFSAGADLNWMRSNLDSTYADIYDESRKLYELYEKLYNLPCLTMTVAHGASIGGANGLIAASDIAMAETDTTFSFSEVKLALLPATISPFVINRTGEYPAKYYMLTGLKFTSKEALRIGLINQAGDKETIEKQVDKILSEVEYNNYGAMVKTKQLINSINKPMNYEEIKAQTIDLISKARVSEEGREGIESFFEKRTPQWMKK
ncbi:MAG: enoyl-CoA hydratase-related protein [Bacteroidales bacterium]